MAGAGFKDFAVGEVLTASDVDTYLMQQSVMRFADSAARGSALGTATGAGTALAEGMVSYLDDANHVEFYNGSGWLLAGSIQQIVAATDTTDRSTTSATLVDAGISVSITPKSATSTIYIVWNAEFGADRGSDSYMGTYAAITDSSDVELSSAETTPVVLKFGSGVWSPANMVNTMVASVSSGSTAARTYKGRYRMAFSTTLSPISYINNASKTGLMLAIEVA